MVCREVSHGVEGGPPWCGVSYGLDPPWCGVSHGLEVSHGVWSPSRPLVRGGGGGGGVFLNVTTPTTPPPLRCVRQPHGPRMSTLFLPVKPLWSVRSFHCGGFWG